MRGLILVGALLATGCTTVGPDYRSPDAAQLQASPTQFWPMRNCPGRSGSPADLARWWEGFNDPLLTRLVLKAAQGNLDVESARARLAQAQAASRALEPPAAVGRRERQRRHQPPVDRGRRRPVRVRSPGLRADRRFLFAGQCGVVGTGPVRRVAAPRGSRPWPKRSRRRRRGRGAADGDRGDRPTLHDLAHVAAPRRHPGGSSPRAGGACAADRHARGRGRGAAHRPRPGAGRACRCALRSAAAGGRSDRPGQPNRRAARRPARHVARAAAGAGADPGGARPGDRGRPRRAAAPAPRSARRRAAAGGLDRADRRGGGGILSELLAERAAGPGRHGARPPAHRRRAGRHRRARFSLAAVRLSAGSMHRSPPLAARSARRSPLIANPCCGRWRMWKAPPPCWCGASASWGS
jgi:hypothetical protein